MKLWHKIALGLLLVSMLLFVGSFLFPATHQICAPNEYTHAKECAQYHLGPYVIGWVIRVIDAHNSLVTAIATVVLTISTVMLWKATRDTAKIAEQTLRDLERPYIFVSEFAWTAVNDRQEYLGDLDYITLKYTVSNEGKIPAIIDHVWSHISVGTSPDIVGTSSISRQIQILPPGNRWETSDSVHESNMEAKTVIEYGGCVEYRIPRHLADESVFFQCVITYHGPFTSGHETSACLRCEDILLSFEEIGGAKFNYVR